MAQASSNAALGRPVDDDAPEDEDLDFISWQVRELVRAVRHARDRLRPAGVRSHSDTLLTKSSPADNSHESEGTQSGRGSQRGFMQKYYHRGAFYMDEDSVNQSDDIRNRAKEYAGARTGQDLGVNKVFLPKMMQVRDFGRRSRSKWTHLSNEDTSAEGDALR